VEWEKVACWSTKAAISLKRIKIDEKLPWRAYRKSQTLFRTVPTPTPYGLPFLKIGGLQPTPKLQSLLSQERLKLQTANLADTFHSVHRNTSTWIILEKGSVGVSRDCPSFWSTPYYLTNGYSYELQIWHAYSQGPCEQKPLKNFGEKGAWAYPGTSQIFWVPIIISGMVKAMNFKFGRCIHSVHANKSPLKIWEKGESGHIQGLWKFVQYPLLSQERVKLRTSNFVRTFLISIGTKAHYKFREK